MCERSYPEWKIHHFVGRSTTSITRPKMLFNCEVAMRVAIPSLDTLTVGGFLDGCHTEEADDAFA
jgi:hypothetical protein